MVEKLSKQRTTGPCHHWIGVFRRSVDVTLLFERQMGVTGENGKRLGFFCYERKKWTALYQVELLCLRCLCCLVLYVVRVYVFFVLSSEYEHVSDTDACSLVRLIVYVCILHAAHVSSLSAGSSGVLPTLYVIDECFDRYVHHCSRRRKRCKAVTYLIETPDMYELSPQSTTLGSVVKSSAV